MKKIDVKEYLEQSNKKHWKDLMECSPAFLAEIDGEITTEVMHRLMFKHLIELENKVQQLRDELAAKEELF